MNKEIYRKWKLWKCGHGGKYRVINWSDKARNEDVLQLIEEDRTVTIVNSIVTEIEVDWPHVATSRHVQRCYWGKTTGIKINRKMTLQDAG